MDMQHLCRRAPYAAAARSTASRAERKDFTCASDAPASTVQPPRGWQQEAMHRAQRASSHHVPPWPNGQGVGLLIRRLRAQVPQGVLYRHAAAEVDVAAAQRQPSTAIVDQHMQLPRSTWLLRSVSRALPSSISKPDAKGQHLRPSSRVGTAALGKAPSSETTVRS